MKYYEIWEKDGRWLIYEVTDYTHYNCIGNYATKLEAESWAKKQWHEVKWR